MKLQLGFTGERFIYLPIKLLNEMQKNPLTGDLYIYSLGYFSKATYHYIDRPKGCDQYLLIFCKAGKGTIYIENRKYILTENQYIILPANVRHKYYASDKDPWSIYWIHFKGSKAPIISKGKDKPNNISLSISYCRVNRFELFEEIYETLRNSLSWENINYANFCFSYFISTLIYDKLYKNTDTQSEYRGTIINRSIYYMKENLNKSLTVKEVASFVNYSVSFFYRKFIKEIGIPPMEYFTRMKLEKACMLLISSELHINQIASLLGYTDALYFSRLFSKEIGVSPKRYRELNKEGQTEHI